MTSNITLGASGRYLGDATLAAAILDFRVNIDRPSNRQQIARNVTARRAPS